MADYTFKSDFPIRVDKAYDTLVSDFENGAEQRRSRRSKIKRKFTLEYSNRTQAEKDAVEDFFDAKLGRLTAFTFTNPNDSTDYTVRFNMDNFEASRVGPGLYNFTVELIEVI